MNAMTRINRTADARDAPLTVKTAWNAWKDNTIIAIGKNVCHILYKTGLNMMSIASMTWARKMKNYTLSV